MENNTKSPELPQSSTAEEQEKAPAATNPQQRPKGKHHKEIQLKTLDEGKLKDLSESMSSNIEVITFRLENKGIFDAQGINFNNALKLFAKKGAKKLRIYLTNNPVTHITLEEICKNMKEYLPNLEHLVFQLDQTLVNDQAINYIFEMLQFIGEYLKVFEISLTGSSVTDLGMSDLFQALKFLPLECDVYVGNEDSETLSSLAKEFANYQKFQRMLQKGKTSQSESDEDEEESDEEGTIKIRNLDEENSEDENEIKKKKKQQQNKKQKKKKGMIKTTKQQSNQFPQMTPQMLAGINPVVLYQMYTQMMQQRMPMNKINNPYMWQQFQCFNNPMQQKQLQMQNMMMWQQMQQQQGQQQGQKLPMGFRPQQFPQQQMMQQQQQQAQKGEKQEGTKQQQQQQQFMQQQAMAFSQLQKSMKEVQKNQVSGEQQKKNEQDDNEKIENKKKETSIPAGFNQQQLSAFSELQRNLKDLQSNQTGGGAKEVKKNETEEKLEDQQKATVIDQKQVNIQQQIQNQQPAAIQRMPMPQQPFQQPQQKPQVNDFELILEKLRSQQAMIQQQQQQQNQQNDSKAANENIPQIGKPVQAIPPGFKQKLPQQQPQQESQQSLQKSIESYFANLSQQQQQQPQQQQQQNQKQNNPKENQQQGQQFSQLLF